jgi:hypothetical protein
VIKYSAQPTEKKSILKNYIYVPSGLLKEFTSVSSLIILAIIMIVGLYLKYNYPEEGRWDKDWNKKKKKRKGKK